MHTTIDKSFSCGVKLSLTKQVWAGCSNDIVYIKLEPSSSPDVKITINGQERKASDYGISEIEVQVYVPQLEAIIAMARKTIKSEGTKRY